MFAYLQGKKEKESSIVNDESHLHASYKTFVYTFARARTFVFVYACMCVRAREGRAYIILVWEEFMPVTAFERKKKEKPMGGPWTTSLSLSLSLSLMDYVCNAWRV
jgi:hypothetical protein